MDVAALGQDAQEIGLEIAHRTARIYRIGGRRRRAGGVTGP
jgi:hypothetical protein